MRRYALHAPCVTFWQLTKAKCTDRESFGDGAVTVRPRRLPKPYSSVKRYQYTRPGFRFAANTRQVQSVCSETAASDTATTRLNSKSSATSRGSLRAIFLP